MIKLAIVVPCYNEEEVIAETTKRFDELLSTLIAAKKVAADSAVYYVDDGSTDGTWDLISSIANDSDRFHGIKLARNVGHQNALMGGLMTAQGDAIVSIDADLQDDVFVIKQMVEDFLDGKDVVFGVRKRRDSDTIFKRMSAVVFYRMLNWLGVDVIHNHADFRLLSRRAIESLREFGEVNLFLRGVVPLLGYESSVVYYNRNERFAGESKYSLSKMIGLAIDGVTSFSVVPLRFITLVGMLLFLGSIGMTGWILFSALLTDDVVPGWASTVLPIYFIGGVQLLCIGVIGEYAGKIYKEVKRRPRFIIEETT